MPELRQHLVDVTVDLLARDGTEAVSLREIARRAGVSHGAPLRHYPNLANLLSHVAGEGFVRLRDRIDVALDSMADASAADRLAASGRSYVHFAVDDPGHYTLMFRFDLLDLAEPAFTTPALAAFNQLVDLVRAAQADGWRSDVDSIHLAGVLWSTMHGISSLWLDGALAGTTLTTTVDPVLELALGTLIDTTPTRNAEVVSERSSP